MNFLLSQISRHTKDGDEPKGASQKLVFGKYFAGRILLEREFGQRTILHACLDNKAQLKAFKSQNPTENNIEALSR